MAAVPWGTPGAFNRVGYDPTIADMVVPWFAILKFFFYFGWLYVSQVREIDEDDILIECSYFHWVEPSFIGADQPSRRGR